MFGLFLYNGIVDNRKRNIPYEVAAMKHFHFIGIKGSGMSALAQILHDLGHHVQGEDIPSFLFTQAPLDTRRISLYGFGEAPLTKGMTVIVSNAYDDTHPSMIRCMQMGLSIKRYHHFLGEWMKDYTTVAITGAHGKTTTTGMMVHALKTVEPACSLIGDGTGMGFPDSRLFVFESCEYRRHFLAYRPDIAVITNIDFDHPDYFADIDDVRHAFEEMITQTTRHIVACGDDPQVRLLKTGKDLLYYGFGEDNALTATNLSGGNAGLSFDVLYHKSRIANFHLPVYGRHNVLNALAVIGVALTLDLEMKCIRDQLASFTGVKRRFTESVWGSNVIIDDYAHHPTEIQATIEAARSKYPRKTIVAIFQPHTFSRLEKMTDAFASSLRLADEVYLCEIFGSAREKAGNITIDDLMRRIPGARHLTGDIRQDLAGYEDAVLVFMGAGDIEKFQAQLHKIVL